MFNFKTADSPIILQKLKAFFHMQLAPFIDHTMLKQTTTQADVQRVCEEAAQYHFAAVCIPPVYVAEAAKRLENTEINVCTVIGFPFGYHTISTKLQEMKDAVAAGANELDVVMNITALKNGNLDLLKQEIETLSTFSNTHNTILKVIIESSILSDSEISTCCALYKNFPVNFLKTSTGFAEGGATVRAVQLMRRQLPSFIQIKASGGIRTAAVAREMIAAGATRLGCSASVTIVNEQPSDATY